MRSPSFEVYKCARAVLCLERALQSLQGSVNLGWLRAVGIERQCAPAVLNGHSRAAPQLHRWAATRRAQ